MPTSQLPPHRAPRLRRGARALSSRLRGRLLRVPLPRHRRMVGAAMATPTPLPSLRTRSTSSAPTRTEAKHPLPSNGSPAQGKSSSCVSSSRLRRLLLRRLLWPSRLSRPMVMLEELTPGSRLPCSTGGLLALTLCRALRRHRHRRLRSRCT